MRADKLLIDGPDDAAQTLVLAHGAGQGMLSPFMQTVASGIAANGIRVVRFEFPYMVKAKLSGRKHPPDREPILEQTWREVIAGLRTAHIPCLAIGGKSMGGRIASQVVDEPGVSSLVCLGYPFHPPGKPERLRFESLERVSVPTLICQGERDPFGRIDEVQGYCLSPAVRLHWVTDGEHSFKPRKRAGLTQEQNLAEVVAQVGAFLKALAEPG
jgi:predicted alpha/beta-hydrolase family hydrolase